MPNLNLTSITPTTPADASNAGAGAAAFRALATELEARVPRWESGVFASRPAAVAGSFYGATDTQTIYLGLGSPATWRQFYPVPDFAITAVKIDPALKPSGTAADTTEALRGLGNGAGQAMPGTTDLSIYATTTQITAADAVINAKVRTGKVGQLGTVAVPGTGFTVARTGVGHYQVSYSTPFAIDPILVIDVNTGIPIGANRIQDHKFGFEIELFDAASTPRDRDFYFIARVP